VNANIVIALWVRIYVLVGVANPLYTLFGLYVCYVLIKCLLILSNLL